MKLSKLIKEVKKNQKPVMTPEESIKMMNEHLFGADMILTEEYQEQLAKVTIEKIKEASDR